MNFQYMENFGACFGDDIDAKMDYFKHQMVIQCTLRRFDAQSS